MSIKGIFSILLLGLAALLYFNFVVPFKSIVVDPVNQELDKVQAGYEKSVQLTSLNNLRQKRQTLDDKKLTLIGNFIPKNLHSGDLIYKLSQTALSQNLKIKGIQFSQVDDKSSIGGDKKLLLEINLEGRYEDFIVWLSKIERSDTLIDVDSLNASKNSTNDIISFRVKLYAYGINID